MSGPGVSGRSALLVSIVVGAAVLAAPPAGRAQDLFSSTGPPGARQETATQADSAGPGLQAIPLSEIPLKADDALGQLQAIATQLTADPDLLLIEEDLPDELAAVARAHERLGDQVLEHLSTRELWNLRAVWSSHEEKLSRWARAFEEELEELAGVAGRGGRIRDTWRLTSEVLAREEAPPRPLVEQVERVLLAASGLEETIGTRLTYLLGVKTELDEGLEGVRHVLREIEGARASVRGRIRARNAPPLWRIAGFESDSATAARAWSEEREAVVVFSSNHPGSFLVGAAMLLFFLLLGVRLRDRVGAELDPSDESLKSAAQMLRRPVSAAVLLTLFASNVFWKGAPFVFWQVLALVAVVPLYRLLPSSRNAVIHRTVRVLLVLFAVVAVADLVVQPSVEFRVVSLLTALVLSATCGWLLRGADPERMRETAWGTIVWRGLQVALFVGIISVTANVLGWTLLAEALASGLLYSAFLGLSAVIGYRVLAGMIRLVPRTQIGEASHIISRYGDVVTSRAIVALKIIALASWIWLALEAFQVSDVARTWVTGLLTGAIRIGAVEFSLAKVLSFAALVLAAIWIARFVAFVLDVEVLPRLRLKRGASNAISTVVQWAILGAGILMAGSALGLQAAQLAIVFGALSVGIGFGLQNIVSNFVSGLILIFEQPVKVGDKVEITSLALTGEVSRIGIRASVVRTFDGAEVIVPNGNLISSEVINWTLSDQRRRVRVEVGVAYGTDPHRVIEILKSVAAGHPEVLRYPEPAVVFLEFADSSLNFRLLFWTATFDDFYRVRSEVYVRVNDALKEAGITIPFPQRDLHVTGLSGRSGAESGPDVAPPAIDVEPDEDPTERG